MILKRICFILLLISGIIVINKLSKIYIIPLISNEILIFIIGFIQGYIWATFCIKLFKLK